MDGNLTRRRLLGATASAGLAGAVPATTAATGEHQTGLEGVELPADWPMYQYDHRNTGRPPGATGPTTDVAPAWCTEFRTTSRNSPVAAGDGLYHAGWDTVGKLDPESGELLWTRTVDATTVSTPVVVDGTVYATELEGAVVAFDAEEGDLDWRTGLRGETRSAPAVVDGRVFATTKAGVLSALSPADGSTQWTATTDGGIEAPPQVHDGTVFVSGLGPSGAAFDAATGEQLWTYDYRGVEVPPAVADGRVYLNDGVRLYAVDAATGEEHWRLTPEVPPGSAPTVVDGTIYYGAWPDRDDGYVVARDAESGDLQWRYGAPEGWLLGAVTVADGTVFAGSKDGTVHAVDAASGRRRWTYDVGGDVEAAPTVVDGAVYVTSERNYVYGLARASSVSDPATDCGRGATATAPSTASGGTSGPSGQRSDDRPREATADGSAGETFLEQLWQGPRSFGLLVLGIPLAGPLVLGSLLWLLGLVEDDDASDRDGPDDGGRGAGGDSDGAGDADGADPGERTGGDAHMGHGDGR